MKIADGETTSWYKRDRVIDSRRMVALLWLATGAALGFLLQFAEGNDRAVEAMHQHGGFRVGVCWLLLLYSLRASVKSNFTQSLAVLGSGLVEGESLGGSIVSANN